MNKIRPLKAEEIEARVAQVSAKGCQLLLYKDARCDKRILDEVFGINGWKNRYEVVKNNLFCTISIWDDAKNQWIDKQDCGTESNTEKEKGEASDAFKRACFNIGIGRELYTKIFIWVQVETVQIKDNTGKAVLKNGKPVYELKDRFTKWHVSKLETDTETEKIVALEIQDDKGIVAFTYPNSRQTPKKPVEQPTKQESVNMNQLDEVVSKYVDITGSTIDFAMKNLENTLKKHVIDFNNNDIAKAIKIIEVEIKKCTKGKTA